MRTLFSLTLLLSIANALAQPGTLDTSFGSNGLAIAAVTGSYSSGEAIAEQPDGKIVVGGATPGYALLARFNTDGTLDSGFGENGLVLTDVDASNDFISSVAVQPNGRIVAGGVRFNAQADGRAIVMRYLPNGDLDAGFGTNGIRTIDFSGTTDSFIKGLVLQSDGRIVACGERYTGTAWESFVLRLNSDGTTDGGFGIVELDITTNGDDNATDITMQSDGRVVVCGTAQSITGGGMFIARLNANGSFDSSFGNGGKLVLDVGGEGADAANSIRVQDDGKILVCGVLDTQNGYRIGVTRLLVDGTLDAGFATNGTFEANIGIDDWAMPSIALQPDGKILIGTDNSTGNPSRVKVIRLLGNGTYDTTFGTNGIGTSDATGSNYDENGRRTILLSDGGIAVAGIVDTPNNIQVAVWKFRSGLNVGVYERNTSEGLRIQPNPVDDILHVLIPDGLRLESQVMVLDPTGRVVPVPVTRSATDMTMDTSQLPSGMYTITVDDRSMVRTERFIKH